MRQLLDFLRLVGCCRMWIPCLNPYKENWPLSQYWILLKTPLSSFPSLGLPNYSLPFSLFIHEREEHTLDVLSQKYKRSLRPTGYLTFMLGPMAQACLPCFWVVMATANLIQATVDFVLGHTSHTSVPKWFTSLSWLQTPNIFQPLTLPLMRSFCLLLLTLLFTITKILTLWPFLSQLKYNHHDCILAT